MNEGGGTISCLGQIPPLEAMQFFFFFFLLLFVSTHFVFVDG